MSKNLLFLILMLGLLVQACTGSTQGLSVGDSAPQFSLPDTKGNSVALSDYLENQPVLLYFHMALG